MGHVPIPLRKADVGVKSPAIMPSASVHQDRMWRLGIGFVRRPIRQMWES